MADAVTIACRDDGSVGREIMKCYGVSRIMPPSQVFNGPR